MKILVTLTTAGIDTGPFNLYSNVNGFIEPFAELIEKSVLLAGYTSTVVPDGTTSIEVRSVNELCNNFITLTVDATTSTTTSTTSTSTSTTTTTTTSLPSILICEQEWTLYNLDVTKYRNGDIIPQVTNAAQWSALTTGAWCYYNNTTANGTTYGKLYNWYAVKDPRGLAPLGYHIPTEAEWQTLTNTCLGGATVAGGKMKETGLTHWNSPNTGATNSSGFTGLPGGYRDINSSFAYLGTVSFWWSSSESNSDNAWYTRAYWSSADSLIIQQVKQAGMSVRLIKD